MEPSSRTPEGEANTCPVCGHHVRIEPSRPPGDAPCPHCGTLLWFAADAVGSFDARQAAILWERANALVEANHLHAAKRRLERASALDPSNTVVKETLASVESRLRKTGRRKPHERPRRQRA